MCLSKLSEVISFRNQCRKIHEKQHPNAKIRITEVQAEDIFVEAERSNLTNEEISQSFEEQGYPEESYSISLIENTKKRSTLRKKASPKKERIEVLESTLINDGSVIIYETKDQSELYEPNDTQYSDGSNKISRKSWTQNQKLSIIAYAEEHGNRKAARRFGLNESSVRCFRRQKDQLQTMQPSKSTNRHGVAYWPELENNLKDWVNAQPTKPKIHEIQKEACELAKSFGYENFSGSTSYIFKFMQRNGINSSSPRPRKNLSLKIEDESMEMEEAQ